jgi:nitrogen regulatory protein PII-like uncharacterized protein
MLKVIQPDRDFSIETYSLEDVRIEDLKIKSEELLEKHTMTENYTIISKNIQKIGVY